MAWAAIGTTVAGGLVGKLFGGKQSTQNTPGAVVSDPFASQRQQYQPQLQFLMGRGSSPSMDFTDYSGGGNVTSTTGGGLSPFNPNVSLANPTSMRFDPALMETDPAYKFRLEQGTAALDRNAARTGMIGSGNQMAELMTYGQNMATQEYDKVFQRNMGVHQQEQTDFNNTFQRGMQLHGQQEADYGNQFNRLATLSGATSGSPATAGQLVSQQAQRAQDSTNALTGKVVGLGAQAIGNWLGGNQNTAPQSQPYIPREYPQTSLTTDPTGLNGIPRSWFGNTTG